MRESSMGMKRKMEINSTFSRPSTSKMQIIHKKVEINRFLEKEVFICYESPFLFSE
jgi:hypothetical protein